MTRNLQEDRTTHLAYNYLGVGMSDERRKRETMSVEEAIISTC
jgi:hypothetical protein